MRYSDTLGINMKNELCSPIAMFVYDRLDVVEATIDKLKLNEEFSKTDLYVFSDGDKGSNREKIIRVRSYINSIKGFKSLNIIESNNNLGLEQSIVKGIDHVLTIHESIIVIEDDIEVGKYFLKFMNDALVFYKNQSDIMHVSGYFDPVELVGLQEDTFFYPTASCWGWGTWKDSWIEYETDAKYLYDELSRTEKLKDFDLGGCDLFRSQLLDNVYGIKKTWAIKWMASIYLQDGRCLHPKFSLTKNIGFGEDSTNTKKMNAAYCKQVAYEQPLNVRSIEKRNLEEAISKMREFYLFNGYRNRFSKLFIFMGKKVKRLIRDVKRRFV
jgi:hypothetical protein